MSSSVSEVGPEMGHGGGHHCYPVPYFAHMIPHHAGAIQLTHNALRHIDHAELESIARSVIDMQSKEIGEMHEKKEELCRDTSVECMW